KFVFVNLVLSALLEPLVAVETFRVRGAVRVREPRAARGAADAARVGGKFVFGNLVLPVVLLTQLVLVGRFVFVIRVAGAARGGGEVRVREPRSSSALLEPLVAVETFRVRGAVCVWEPRAVRGAADAAREVGAVCV
ncbi:hypothetical protein PR001_g33715, partial [Phytophthora rubi]